MRQPRGFVAARPAPSPRAGTLDFESGTQRVRIAIPTIRGAGGRRGKLRFGAWLAAGKNVAARERLVPGPCAEMANGTPTNRGRRDSLETRACQSIVTTTLPSALRPATQEIASAASLSGNRRETRGLISPFS